MMVCFFIARPRSRFVGFSGGLLRGGMVINLFSRIGTSLV